MLSQVYKCHGRKRTVTLILFLVVFVGAEGLWRAQTTTSQSGVGTAKPGSAAKSGLSRCPDYSLKQKPHMPISVKFLVTHRTALNGKVVQVKGIVVATSEPATANPSSGAIPVANANPQPRLFLADTSRKDRDKDYDLTVLLAEGEDQYDVGETVEIKGVVEASKTAVYLRKNQ